VSCPQLPQVWSVSSSEATTASSSSCNGGLATPDKPGVRALTIADAAFAQLVVLCSGVGGGFGTEGAGDGRLVTHRRPPPGPAAAALASTVPYGADGGGCRAWTLVTSGRLD